MSEAPAPVTTGTNTESPSVDPEGGLHDRAAQIIQQAMAERGDEPEPDEGGSDGAEPASAAAPAAKVADAHAPVEDAATKERQERLRVAKDLERQNVRAKHALAAKDRELAGREKTLTEREERIQHLEKTFDSPETLLGLLAERVGPEKLSQWLIESSQPEKQAEWRTKSATKPMEERLAKLEKELQAKERTLAEASHRQGAEKAFVDRVTSEDAKTGAPITARWMEKRPAELMKMAHAAADELSREGLPFNHDDVIMRLERELASLTEVYAPQQVGAPVAAAPSQTERSSTAAAKAPTVSNRDAAERASLLSEDESSLPLEERVRRVERRVRSAG